MKKLFLTSGIIACMACPAFADPVTPTFADNLGNTETPTPLANQCIESNLGTYDTSASFTAIWESNYEAMALDYNEGSTTATGGMTDNYTSEPNLFLVGGNGIYTRTANGNTGEWTFTLASEGTTSVATPVGISVNYVNNVYTLPSTATTVATNTLQDGSSIGDTRAFLGYYETVNDADVQRINASGVLQPGAISASVNYDNSDPWFAKYGLVSPTVTEPTAYGYHFTGWKINNTGETIATANLQPIGEDKSLYAQWAPDQYKLAYSCRNADNTLGGGTPSVDPYSNIPVTFDMTTFTWANNTDSGNNQNCHQDGYHFTGWSCSATVQEGGNTTTLQNFTLTSTGNMTCSDGSDAHDNPGTCTGTQLANFNPTGLQNGASITCNAVYAKNVIALTWTDPLDANYQPDGGASCTYTEGITLPSNPEKTGYVFKGWLVE